MNASQIKRTDQLSRSLRGGIGELRSEVRNDMSELHEGQKKLIDSTAKLDSRISRLEGMLQPRPWVEGPVGDMPPVSATQG